MNGRTLTRRSTPDPSKLKLELDIPRGDEVELALFKALLLCAEGRPVMVCVGTYDESGEDDDDYSVFALHGGRECIALIENGVYVEHIDIERDDPAEVERICCAFDRSDWPQLLEAVRANFVKRRASNERYREWARREIVRRGEWPDATRKRARLMI